MDSMDADDDATCSIIDTNNNWFENSASTISPFDCSGHGTCIDGQCVCDSGWTGRSDWIDLQGMNCHINKHVLRGLWSFDLLVGVFLLAKSIRPLQNHITAFRKRKRVKTDHSLTKDKVFLCVLVQYIISFPAFIMYAISRIADIDLRLGLDVLPSVLYAMVMLGFYLQGLIFQPAILHAVLGYHARANAVKSILQLHYVVQILLQLVNILIGFLPLLALVFPASSITPRLSIVATNGISKGITLWINSLLAFLIHRSISQVLDERKKVSTSVSNASQLPSVKANLSRVLKSEIRVAAVNGAITIAFGTSSVLWIRHDYWLPIAFIAIQSVGYSVLVSKTFKKASDSSSRGGSSKTASQFKSSPNNINSNNSSKNGGHEKVPGDLSKKGSAPEGSMYEESMQGGSMFGESVQGSVIAVDNLLMPATADESNDE